MSLIHLGLWGLNEMAAMLHTTVCDAFSCIKSLYFHSNTTYMYSGNGSGARQRAIGCARQKAINWASIDPYLCHHIISLCYNELRHKCHGHNMIPPILKSYINQAQCEISNLSLPEYLTIYPILVGGFRWRIKSTILILILKLYVLLSSIWQPQ